MATPSSILAGRIPWTEEPSGLQSIGKESDTTQQLNTHTHTHTHTDNQRGRNVPRYGEIEIRHSPFPA